MARGLRIRNAKGDIVLDTTDMAGKVRYTAFASAGASGSVTLSDIKGRLTDEDSIGLGTTDDTFGAVWAAHSVWRSAEKIEWSPESATGTSSMDSLIIVVLRT